MKAGNLVKGAAVLVAVALALAGALMDLGDQAHRVKLLIRDRGSNFTAAFDAILADAGIRTVLCNVRTPRMNAISRTPGRKDAAASSWTAPSSGTRPICGRSCASTSRVLAVHCCTGGPLRTAHARSRAHGPGKPLGRFGLSAAPWCFPLSGAVCSVGRLRVRGCPLAPCGAGRVVADEVVRLDRLPGDLQEPVLPALGGLGWLVWGQQVLPAQTAPPVLPGKQAHGAGVQRGFHLSAARCAQYPARPGSSGDAPPLTRVCRTISVQAGFGR